MAGLPDWRTLSCVWCNGPMTEHGYTHTKDCFGVLLARKLIEQVRQSKRGTEDLVSHAQPWPKRGLN